MINLSNKLRKSPLPPPPTPPPPNKREREREREREEGGQKKYIIQTITNSESKLKVSAYSRPIFPNVQRNAWPMKLCNVKSSTDEVINNLQGAHFEYTNLKQKLKPLLHNNCKKVWRQGVLGERMTNLIEEQS